MALGIDSTGFYGRIRILVDSIRNDEEYLENGPLGPVQRKRLTESINKQKAELKKIRAELRLSKAKLI